MAQNAESKVGRGTVVISLPRSRIAASSLKAPHSPWNATRRRVVPDEVMRASDIVPLPMRIRQCSIAEASFGAQARYTADTGEAR